MTAKELRIKKAELKKAMYEKRTGLKLSLLPARPEFEVGKTYYCGYWQQTYTVLEKLPHPVWGTTVKCQWQDGHINAHATDLRQEDDFEVIGGI